MFAESLMTLVGLLSLQTGTDAVQPTYLRALPLANPVTSTQMAPVKKNTESVGVDVTARAAAILDVQSGQFLFLKDSNAPYPIASLTKLVTAMVFLDSHPDFTKEITFTAEDETAESRSPFLAGETLSEREWFESLLVGSVNAAGNVLARADGNREAYLKAMNDKARELGMEHAIFYDPTGLDRRNKASAKDVALALRAALSYPQIRDITKLERVQFKGRLNGKTYLIKSTNLLLTSFLNKTPYKIIAGKTGSLPEAGFCMAQATQDQKGNEVIAVVLGSDNHFARFQDAKALTYWAFKNYDWLKANP